MIKILFEHGKLFGEESNYGIKVIAINQENKNYCDVINSFAYLSKLNEKELDNLFTTLEYIISSVSLGTVTNRGIEYVEPIAEIIMEKYAREFE